MFPYQRNWVGLQVYSLKLENLLLWLLVRLVTVIIMATVVTATLLLWIAGN
jgi:hypothetical protein